MAATWPGMRLCRCARRTGFSGQQQGGDRVGNQNVTSVIGVDIGSNWISVAHVNVVANIDVMGGVRIELNTLLGDHIVDRRAKVITEIVYRYNPAMTGLETHINTTSFPFSYIERRRLHV
jgi:hypothetical protein